MDSNSELGKDSIIYILVDPRTNQPRYVGKTINLKERLKGHLWPQSLKFKTHKNHWIKNLLKLNLLPILEVIDNVNEKDSEFWEQHYMDLYKSWGFDLTNSICAKKGIRALNENLRKEISLKQSLNRKGKCMGEKNPSKRLEVRKKISNALKGRIFSSETKLKMSIGNKGTKRNFSKEHRKKLSETCKKRNLKNKGRKLSKETKLKISLAFRKEKNPMYKKTHSKEAKLKISLARKGKASWGKEVEQWNPQTGECVKTFPSSAAAERFFNKKLDYISDACRNKKVKLGFKWRYKKVNG